jgi:hypothetical protein
MFERVERDDIDASRARDRKRRDATMMDQESLESIGLPGRHLKDQ